MRAEHTNYDTNFTPLRKNKPPKVFFAGLESFFYRIWPTESKKLSLLSNANASGNVWGIVENSIAQKKSHELIKADIPAELGQLLYYWLIKEIIHAHFEGSLNQWANHFAAMLWHQVNIKISVSNAADPHRYMSIHNMMGQMSRETGEAIDL
jgi:hypothetical protein